MIIALTGAHGFLGQHVLGALNSMDGITVRIVPHGIPLNASGARNLLDGVSLVIHLAGVNRDTPEKLMEGNLLFTVELLECMRRWAPEARIVFASSSQVYLPTSFYGLAKHSAEEAIRLYSRLFGIRSIIFRFSNIYGPFGRPFYNSLIATFVHQAHEGQELTIHGNGEQKRDYLSVNDAVRAIQKVLDYNPTEGCSVFDICSGSAATVKEVVDAIRKVGPWQIAVTYEHTDRIEVNQPVRKPTKANEQLGWSPTVTLEDGLRDLITKQYGNP